MSYPGNQPDPWSPQQQWSEQQPPPPQPPPSRRRAWPWIALSGVLAAVLGGAIWGAVSESRDAPVSDRGGGGGVSRPGTVTSSETRVVTATDGKSRLTVPASWQDLPEAGRNEVATIQLGDLRKEQYVMVITGAKSDFDSLAAFAEAAMTDAENLEESDIGPERALTVGGLPAVQRVVTGKSEGIRIVYWFTMVEGKNSFFQVIGWTLPSRRGDAEPAIAEVIDSFRELGPG
jgi:hypothetical protein